MCLCECGENVLVIVTCGRRIVSLSNFVFELEGAVGERMRSSALPTVFNEFRVFLISLTSATFVLGCFGGNSWCDVLLLCAAVCSCYSLLCVCY